MAIGGMMKTATLLLTVLACGAALAVPAASSAWEPAGAGAETMTAYSTQYNLEVPIYINGTIYFGDMIIECPDSEISFTYWRGEENTLSTGVLGPENGYCYPELEMSTAIDDCELGGLTSDFAMNGHGDPINDVMVLSNAPSFAYEFEDVACPYLDDTFFVMLQEPDACAPTYNESTGEIEFLEMECMEVQESTNPHIRDGDPVEIEGEFFVYDPVSPFPYME